MNPIVPDSLAPGLTDKQLECLHILRDGNWHDRSEIRRKIRNYIPANISGRIIGPLSDRGVVEQEERPVKDGSRKMKKYVRVRQDIDKYMFHLLIEYSANDLALKYQKKEPEKAKFFLKMRDESIKKLEELEKLEEERQQEDEREYWAKRFREYPSEAGQKLVEAERIVYNELKKWCKAGCEVRGRCKEECSLLKKPGVSFIIATLLNKKLVDELIQQEREEALQSSPLPAVHQKA